MRLTFPWWYSWVKWGVPLFLTMLTSLIFGLTVTSAIGTYGFIKWLPQFYATLEGISAILFFSATVCVAASLALVLASLCVRVVLFHVNEELVINLKHHAEKLKKKITVTEEALDYVEVQRKTITTKYHLLREERAVNSKQLMAEESKEVENVPNIKLGG